MSLTLPEPKEAAQPPRCEDAIALAESVVRRYSRAGASA